MVDRVIAFAVKPVARGGNRGAGIRAASVAGEARAAERNEMLPSGTLCRTGVCESKTRVERTCLRGRTGGNRDTHAVPARRAAFERYVKVGGHLVRRDARRVAQDAGDERVKSITRGVRDV